jgi:glyoxylase I family protein
MAKRATSASSNPDTDFMLCLVGHAGNPGEKFSEFRTGLDHLEFLVARHADLIEWVSRLDQMGVEHSGVQDLDDTRNAMLTYRDPDNIQLEFFWCARSAR